MKAIVKHYVGSDTVTLKAFHNEWELDDPREEVQHLADKINELQNKVKELESWQERAFDAHPNIDLDIEFVEELR